MYNIIGTGNVGYALASLFARKGIEVGVANTRGPESARPVVENLGAKVIAMTVDEAPKAEFIFFAVQFLNFKDVGKLRSDWSGNRRTLVG